MMCPARLYKQRVVAPGEPEDGGRYKECECSYGPDDAWIELERFPFAVMRRRPAADHRQA